MHKQAWAQSLSSVSAWGTVSVMFAVLAISACTNWVQVDAHGYDNAVMRATSALNVDDFVGALHALSEEQAMQALSLTLRNEEALLGKIPPIDVLTALRRAAASRGGARSTTGRRARRARELGWGLQLRGEFAPAGAASEAAARLAPRSWRSFALLGGLQLASGEVVAAGQALLHAVELARNSRTNPTKAESRACTALASLQGELREPDGPAEIAANAANNSLPSVLLACLRTCARQSHLEGATDSLCGARLCIMLSQSSRVAGSMTLQREARGICSAALRSFESTAAPDNAGSCAPTAASESCGGMDASEATRVRVEVADRTATATATMTLLRVALGALQLLHAQSAAMPISSSKGNPQPLVSQAQGGQARGGLPDNSAKLSAEALGVLRRADQGAGAGADTKVTRAQATGSTLAAAAWPAPPPGCAQANSPCARGGWGCADGYCLCPVGAYGRRCEQAFRRDGSVGQELGSEYGYLRHGGFQAKQRLAARLASRPLATTRPLAPGTQGGDWARASQPPGHSGPRFVLEVAGGYRGVAEYLPRVGDRSDRGPGVGASVYHNIEPVGGGRHLPANHSQARGWAQSTLPLLLEDYTPPTTEHAAPDTSSTQESQRGAGEERHAAARSLVTLGFAPPTAAFCGAYLRLLEQAHFGRVVLEAPLLGDLAAMDGTLAALRHLQRLGYSLSKSLTLDPCHSYDPGTTPRAEGSTGSSSWRRAWRAPRHEAKTLPADLFPPDCARFIFVLHAPPQSGDAKGERLRPGEAARQRLLSDARFLRFYKGLLAHVGHSPRAGTLASVCASSSGRTGASPPSLAQHAASTLSQAAAQLPIHAVPPAPCAAALVLANEGQEAIGPAAAQEERTQGEAGVGIQGEALEIIAT